MSAVGLTLGRVQSPELRSESDTDSSTVTAATADFEVSKNRHAIKTIMKKTIMILDTDLIELN